MSISSQDWSGTNKNYEQKAMYHSYSDQDNSDNSNKNEYKQKPKLDVFRSTLKLQETTQLSDTVPQNSSDFDQFGSTDMRHRQLAENYRKNREIRTEEFEKANQKLRDLRDARSERTDVSSIDYNIAYKKLRDIDKKTRGLG